MGEMSCAQSSRAAPLELSGTGNSAPPWEPPAVRSSVRTLPDPLLSCISSLRLSSALAPTGFPPGFPPGHCCTCGWRPCPAPRPRFLHSSSRSSLLTVSVTLSVLATLCVFLLKTLSLDKVPLPGTNAPAEDVQRTAVTRTAHGPRPAVSRRSTRYRPRAHLVGWTLLPADSAITSQPIGHCFIRTDVSVFLRGDEEGVW